MAITLYPPTRPRTLAELLDSSLKIFRATLPKCMPYGSLAILLLQLPTLYELSRGRMPPLIPSAAQMNDPVWITLYTVGYLLFCILWMATLLRQATVAAGRAAGPADLLEALKQTPAIVAIILLGNLLILLLLSSPIALTELFRSVVLSLPQAMRLSQALIGPLRAVLFGVMLLASIYALVALSLALPARMLTHKSVLQSLAYSVRLVRGNWWRTLALYAIAASIIITVLFFAEVMAALILPGATHQPAARALIAAVMLALLAMGGIFFTAIVLNTFSDLELRQSGKPG